MHFKKSLTKNVEILKSKLPSEDISFLDLEIDNAKATLVFVNDLTDKEHIGELILRPASAFKEKLTPTSFFNTFLSPEKTKKFDFDKAIDELFLGNALLLADGIDFALTALFIVLLIEQLKKTKNPLPPIIGGGCSVIAFFTFGPDNMLIASLAIGIAFLMILQKPLQKVSNSKNSKGENDA